MRLPRLLNSFETWGFGFTGLMLWLLIAPAVRADLGPQAMFVWVPVALVGVLYTLQVKRLAAHWPEMSGGSPNYITRLLRDFPWLGRYAAMAYLQGWVSVPPLATAIVADLTAANLAALQRFSR